MPAMKACDGSDGTLGVLARQTLAARRVVQRDVGEGAADIDGDCERSGGHRHRRTSSREGGTQNTGHWSSAPAASRAITTSVVWVPAFAGTTCR